LVGFLNLLINGLIEGLIIALPALALTLIMGINRFPNASAGDTMTFGAYAALGLQQVGITFFSVAVTGALLAGALLSWLSYRLVFEKLSRSPMVASLIASIGIGFVIRSVIGLVAGHDLHTFPLPLVRAWNLNGIRILPTDLAIAGVAGLLLVLVFCWLKLSPSGRQLRAVADNPDLAKLSGIRSRRLMGILWLLSGALCAAGGVLLGMKAVVMPELGWEMLLPAFAAMILGGIGQPVGAVVGAVLMGIAQELSIPIVGPSYKIAVAFVVMLLVLLVRPGGLFGRVEKVR
jgi:neutral amino acid transport system permease protein